MRHAIGAVAFLICACAQETPSAPEAPAATAVASAIELQPISHQDAQGRLGGELGCSFRVGDDLLMLASGIVASQEPSEAVVKRDGTVMQLTASEPGGYDAMVEGETAFAADALTVELRTVAENQTGTEQVAHNATLTARDEAGRERAYEGTWTCGP